MGLSSLVLTQLFSKIAVSDGRSSGTKTEFNVKQPFKVINFGINGKPTKTAYDVAQ